MSRVSLQSPLLQAALRRPTAQLIPRCAPATTTTANSGTARSFSHLPTLRPTLSTPSSSSTIFRAPNQTLLQQPLQLQQTMAAAETLDVIAKSSITAHPALAGCASQIRCGPRPTMSNASRLIQKRRHGFLSRINSKGGRKTLSRRRTKGRKKLSA